MNDKKAGIGSRVRHPQFGEGIITGTRGSSYLIDFIEKGRLEIAQGYSALEILEAVEPCEEMVNFNDIEKSLIKILRKWSDTHEIVPLTSKWVGGKMILQPGDESLQPKEIPIETFFHKIVMIRDRLRVLEQNINSNKSLPEDEKIHLQQYITRIYGSLTTFNIFFKSREEGFIGESGKNS